MAVRPTFTEKTTAPITFQLLENGSPFNLTGIPIGNVVLLLNDVNGASVYTTGALAYVDALNGKVKYTPAVTDLVATMSPYAARWKVTDGSGFIKYFPSGLRDLWEITAE